MTVDLPWTQTAVVLCFFAGWLLIRSTLRLALPYAERAHVRHCATALAMTAMQYG